MLGQGEGRPAQTDLGGSHERIAMLFRTKPHLGCERANQQLHVGLFGGAAPLTLVAANAASDQIIPG